MKVPKEGCEAWKYAFMRSDNPFLKGSSDYKKWDDDYLEAMGKHYEKDIKHEIVKGGGSVR